MAGQTKATAPVGPATVTGYAASGGALVAGVVSAIAEGADAQTWRLLVAAGVLLLFTNGGRYAQAVVREYAKLRREVAQGPPGPPGPAGATSAAPGEGTVIYGRPPVYVGGGQDSAGGNVGGGGGGPAGPPVSIRSSVLVDGRTVAEEVADPLDVSEAAVLDVTPPDDDDETADVHGIGDLPLTGNPPPDEGQAPEPDPEALR